jgi:hypothetical protein
MTNPILAPLAAERPTQTVLAPWAAACMAASLLLGSVTRQLVGDAPVPLLMRN